MSSLMDAQEILKKAKAEYARALRAVDGRLRAAVSQDPSRLPAAREIQATYASGFTAQQLGELFQPAAPPEDENGQPVYPPEGPAYGEAPPDVPVTPEPMLVPEPTEAEQG